MNRKDISISDAKDYFKTYTNQYLIYGEKCILKIKHTYNVMTRSLDIARDIGMSEEDQELAQLIALLHDIGRFEQLKIYNTFEDYNSVDHADLGVKILFDDNLIQKFLKTRKYDQVIYDAIRNHNKFSIDKDISGECLIHSKLIRDADKLDIFRVNIDSDMHSVFSYIPMEYNVSEITESVYDDFINNQVIKKQNRNTVFDFNICCLAFIYDINFNCSYKYILDNQFIQKLIGKMKSTNPKTNRMLSNMQSHALNFLKEKYERD